MQGILVDNAAAAAVVVIVVAVAVAVAAVVVVLAVDDGVAARVARESGRQAQARRGSSPIECIVLNRKCQFSKCLFYATLGGVLCHAHC